MLYSSVSDITGNERRITKVRLLLAAEAPRHRTPVYVPQNPRHRTPVYVLQHPLRVPPLTSGAHPHIAAQDGRPLAPVIPG